MTQSQILNANFDWLQVGKVEHFPEYKIDTQKTMFNRIVEAKRSTFDRSKFTVVGSPTITNDGIASGFSSTDYIRQVSAAVQPTNEVVFKASYKLLVVNADQFIFLRHTVSFNDDGNRYFFSIRPNGTFRFSEQINGSYTEYTNLFGGRTAKANDILDLTIKVKANAFYITAAINNEILGTEVIENRWNAIPPLVENDSVIQWHASGYFRGIVYLTNYFIDVDGLRFFECVKTGVDQIKKDDYRQYEGPTMTADGILTPDCPYAYSQIIKDDLGFNFNQETDWDIFASAYIESSRLPFSGVTYFLQLGGDNGIILLFNADGRATVTIRDENSSVGAFSNLLSGSAKIVLTGKVLFHIYRKGNTFSAKISDGMEWYEIATVTTTKNTSSISNVSFIKTQQRLYVDLNDIRIYAHGELVYQPTLRIPYTQSKTGSKIVDSVYRDRVEQMYNDYGYTHYYTLGDKPEKYNVGVVGNPTLVGGVASGFSSSNYLIANVDIKNSWKIKGKLNCTNVAENTYGKGIISNDDTTNAIYMAFRNSRVYLELNGATSIIGGYLPNITVSNNTDYDFELGYNGTKYYLLLNNNEVWYVNSNVTINTVNTLGIGTRKANRNAYFEGSIDLKQFSITVDGKEVFKGYEHAIPNAYTLSTHKNNDIIDSGNNYEQTADLTLKQWGSCTSGSVVNLLPYKDTNYAVTAPHSAKTANSFTASATGDYIAIGKAVL